MSDKNKATPDKPKRVRYVYTMWTTVADLDSIENSINRHAFIIKNNGGTIVSYKFINFGVSPIYMLTMFIYEIDADKGSISEKTFNKQKNIPFTANGNSGNRYVHIIKTTVDIRKQLFTDINASIDKIVSEGGKVINIEEHKIGISPMYLLSVIIYETAYKPVDFESDNKED